jgi:hypothetical protein
MARRRTAVAAIAIAVEAVLIAMLASIGVSPDAIALAVLVASSGAFYLAAHLLIGAEPASRPPFAAPVRRIEFALGGAWLLLIALAYVTVGLQAVSIICLAVYPVVIVVAASLLGRDGSWTPLGSRS